MRADGRRGRRLHEVGRGGVGQSCVRLSVNSKILVREGGVCAPVVEYNNTVRSAAAITNVRLSDVTSMSTNTFSGAVYILVSSVNPQYTNEE